MWTARQSVLQQGVSPSPGWHDPRWQGAQLDNRLIAGRLQVPQRVATNYQPRNIKRKQRSRQNEGTDKTKTRHGENKDHCCPFFWHTTVFFILSLPAAENTDSERASTFSHLAAEAFKRSRVRAGTARRWGTTWRLWFHNRWDRAFVSESLLVSLQGETVSTEQACLHDTGALAHSKYHRLFLHYRALYNFKCSNKQRDAHKTAFDMGEALSR